MARDAPNPTRFHTFSLGKFQNFSARTDGLIGTADVTPTVGLYSLLYSNSANTIEYFDDGAEGQLVKVVNLVDEPLNFSGDQMLVATSSNLWQNDTITFINHNSSWHEESRSNNSNLDLVVAAEVDLTPSVKNVRTLVIANSAISVITDFDDGYEGQLLTVMCHGSAFKINTSSNFINVGTAGPYSVLSNDAIDLVRYKERWVVRTYAQTP